MWSRAAWVAAQRCMRNAVGTVALTSCRPSSPSATSLTRSGLSSPRVRAGAADRCRRRTSSRCLTRPGPDRPRRDARPLRGRRPRCGSSGSSSRRSLRSATLGLVGVEVGADEVVGRRAVEGASGPVVLVALREELEQVEGPLLPLVGVDVLQHRGRPAVLGGHDRAVPVRRAGDDLRGAALERRDGFAIVGEVHDPECSPEFGHFISFRELGPPARYALTD